MFSIVSVRRPRSNASLRSRASRAAASRRRFSANAAWRRSSAPRRRSASARRSSAAFFGSSFFFFDSLSCARFSFAVSLSRFPSAFLSFRFALDFSLADLPFFVSFLAVALLRLSLRASLACFSFFLVVDFLAGDDLLDWASTPAARTKTASRRAIDSFIRRKRGHIDFMLYLWPFYGF